METKGAIPFHHYPLAPDDTKWSASDEVAKASVDDLKIMCAWVEDGQEDKKGSYKLPHHLADSHKTVRAAVIAAGNVLMGARGGVHGIPKDELEGVKAHLAKHYKEFGLTAPWEPKANKREFSIKNGGEITKVDADKRTVCGYYASFNTVDSDGDVFQPGCFAKTIVENKARIKHLLQHDTNLPIGVPHVLVEDEKGLYFETYISDTELGDETIQLYLDGVYTEHSVGFETINQKADSDGLYPPIINPYNTSLERPANIITEVKLWEGSTVTWGANENTPFMGVKDNTSLELVLKHLTARNALRTKGVINTSELYKENSERLETELKALKDLLSLEPQRTQAETNEQRLVDELTKLKNIF